MEWNNITLQVPASAQQIRTELQGIKDGTPSEVETAKGRLSGVSGAVSISSSPLAGAAGNVTALRASLDGLLAGGGQFLCVHPYIHPIGHRRGDYAFLTPKDGVQAIANKLADPEATPGTGQLACVAIMLCAGDHATFGNHVNAFNSVFPITPLVMAARRAEGLAVLERDKFIRATGPMRPHWKANTPRRHNLATKTDKALGRLLAVAEAVDTGARPEDELAELLTRKAAHVEAAAAAWDDLGATISGDAGRGLYATGTAAGIRRIIAASSTPGPEYKLTAIACWIGPESGLSFFKECFGL